MLETRGPEQTLGASEGGKGRALLGEDGRQGPAAGDWQGRPPVSDFPSVGLGFLVRTK